MDGDGVDGVVSIWRPVRGNHPDRSQGTIGESHNAVSFLCILVEILLAIFSPLLLPCLALVRGTLELEENDVGCLSDADSCSQNIQHSLVTSGKFLHQKTKLHFQVADTLPCGLGVSQQSSLSAGICPLSETIARPVISEIGIGASVDHLGILGVGHPQLTLVAVLKIVRAKPTLGVEITHQTSNAGIGKPLCFQILPNRLLGHSITLSCSIFSCSPH